MWNTFDVNVLVNGSRCKQYNHEGRTYIEAKDGSEWYFQIQNNSPCRVLAVCSVDGLNVLTGETAKPSDSGYIIDSYHSQKIKGFRFSDDEWALFKFGYKVNKDNGKKNEKVYAVSKGSGADRNCGVIGVRLFYEKVKKVVYQPAPSTYTNYGFTGSYAVSASYSLNNTTDSTTTVNWYPPAGANRFNLQNMVEDHYIPITNPSRNDLISQAISDAKAVRHTSLSNPKSAKPANFDMGTEWGKRETSKVQTIDFERGCEAHYVDIYYASRDSLIEIGVPLSNNIKVSRFPESFPSKYAQPPKNWKG